MGKCELNIFRIHSKKKIIQNFILAHHPYLMFTDLLYVQFNVKYFDQTFSIKTARTYELGI